MTVESFEELRTAVRIAELGSLSLAAAARGESVNAVSRRLALLEKRLGVPLFRRTTRRLTVTDEGRTLVEGAGRVLRELEAIEAELAPRSKGPVGQVRLGLRPELVDERGLETLAQALEVHPRLSVQLSVVHERDDPFERGLDLWVHFGQPAPSALVARKLGEAQWALAASPSYARRRGLPRTIDELGQHDCLLAMREGRETHWALRDAQGREHVVRVQGRFESNDPNALIAALRAGVGLGFRPRGEVAREAAAGRLVAVLPGLRSRGVPAYLLMPAARARLPHVRLVAELVAVAVRALVTES